MAFHQTIEIIRYISKLHHQTSDLFTDLEDRASLSKPKMLLNYMADHELQLEQYLKTYTKNAPEGVLNSWFQNAPDLKTLRCKSAKELDNEMTVPEIVSLGVQLDDSYIKVYKHCVDKAESMHQKDLFHNLLSFEENEKNGFVRFAANFEEI